MSNPIDDYMAHEMSCAYVTALQSTDSKHRSDALDLTWREHR
jgi:hypothetical protein